jgi:hypothetical protein
MVIRKLLYAEAGYENHSRTGKTDCDGMTGLQVLAGPG